MTPMRIAILHDYFALRGGGERLILNLAKALNADIYTGFVDRKNTFEEINGLNVKELTKPIKNPVLRTVTLMEKFRKLDLRGKYDFFIFSGTICISAARNRPNLIYLHTPPRHMYDLKEWFLKSAGPMEKIALRVLHLYLYPRDQKYMKQFNIICTNSRNVALRVKKFYGSEMYKRCVPVYTGIDTGKFYHRKGEGFYLSASRLDPLKRIGIVIEAFSKMPDKHLMIIGTGPAERELKKQAEGLRNIRFLGPVGEKQLIDLYARCDGVISANVDEDLGLTAIECQAAGKPAIAVGEGGFKETVIENRTGLFFEPNPDSLARTIKKAGKTRWDHAFIEKNAKKYDISAFVSNIKKIISESSGK